MASEQLQTYKQKVTKMFKDHLQAARAAIFRQDCGSSTTHSFLGAKTSIAISA